MSSLRFAGAPRSHLPHTLAALYALAIAYASLEPFGPWIAPVAGSAFWAFTPLPVRWTRFDAIANFIAYVPFGAFVALMPRRAVPPVRVAWAVLAALVLSFALETLQWYLPARDASIVDVAANAAGGLAGGIVAAALARSERVKRAVGRWRQRVFLPGTLGDVGLALLALWLVAQTNPGIGLFALAYDPTLPPLAASRDVAALFIEAAESALQLLGVGLFVALLVRERRHVGGAVLALIAAALVLKGAAAVALVKPAAWEGWLRAGLTTGIAAGALLLLVAIALPRPAMVAACAVALLSSVGIPLFASDLFAGGAPLTLFSWRYGHLLNFNGLTHTVLLLWPLAAAAWLFVLAGRPGWGRAD
jgi:VanZ family protein